MTNKKPEPDRRKDNKKLKDEMAEGKTPEQVAQIYRKGDKYYCAECNSELPIHQSCPNCHAHIEWDRLLEESR